LLQSHTIGLLCKLVDCGVIQLRFWNCTRCSYHLGLGFIRPTSHSAGRIWRREKNAAGWKATVKECPRPSALIISIHLVALTSSLNRSSFLLFRPQSVRRMDADLPLPVLSFGPITLPYRAWPRGGRSSGYRIHWLVTCRRGSSNLASGASLGRARINQRRVLFLMIFVMARALFKSGGS
jgi:hypothetical protein